MRAKFRVSTIQIGEASGPDGVKVKSTEQISAHAVYDPDPESENHQWSLYTPAGTLMLTINNPMAFDHFTVGQEFFLDMTPVPAKV